MIALHPLHPFVDRGLSYLGPSGTKQCGFIPFSLKISLKSVFLATEDLIELILFLHTYVHNFLI